MFKVRTGPRNRLVVRKELPENRTIRILLLCNYTGRTLLSCRIYITRIYCQAKKKKKSFDKK